MRTPKDQIPFFDTQAAFALRVGQLATLLYEQMEDCLDARDLQVPAYTTSIVQTLYHAGPQSISDLASRLRLSHQLASQRVKWLVREDFAEVAPGRDDARRRIVSLTAAGRAEAEKLQEFLPVLRAAYTDLFEEVGSDLHRAVLRAATALAERPLRERCDSTPTPASHAASPTPNEQLADQELPPSPEESA